MRQKGFTLIETVIVIVVVLIVGYIVFVAVERGIRAYVQSEEKMVKVDEARLALERMTRELRAMRGFTGVGNAVANTQVCFNTMDGKKVSFRYSSPTITREEDWVACPGSSGSILATGIGNFTMAFLNASGAVDPSPPQNTKRIRLRLGATITGGSPVEIESEVYLRNIYE